MESKIFKSYDIRGVYPTEIDDEAAYRIGQAYVKVVKPKGKPGSETLSNAGAFRRNDKVLLPGKVAVGFDVRPCSASMKKSLIEGLRDAGIDVVDIGLCSTEMLYFAVGNYEYAGGVQVTASHNTKEWGGMKLVREEAKPIAGESGLDEMRDLIKAGKEKIQTGKEGKVEEKDVLEDYAKFCLNFVDYRTIKPIKLVFNPNFGFEGELLKKVVELGKLPLELVGLNDTPDGTFPKGQPDPFKPENRPEFVEKVLSSKADLGVAWDADGDRVFFCTKTGKFVEPYYLNALLIKLMLKKYPASKIVYDPRYTWALIDSTKDNGGQAVISKVGHSNIKEAMRQGDAIFCGESSGHTYFKDFWYADAGMLPLMIILEMISKVDKLSIMLQPYFERYFISGESNYEIADAQGLLEKIKQKYTDGQISKFDGLSIDFPDWRFNLRASNTEPLVRLNVEAKSQNLVSEKVKELEELIKT